LKKGRKIPEAGPEGGKGEKNRATAEKETSSAGKGFHGKNKLGVEFKGQNRQLRTGRPD